MLETSKSSGPMLVVQSQGDQSLMFQNENEERKKSHLCRRHFMKSTQVPQSPSPFPLPENSFETLHLFQVGGPQGWIWFSVNGGWRGANPSVDTRDQRP